MPEKKELSGEGGANSGASAKFDPDLEAVMNNWAALPEAIRAGIMAMVKATLGGYR
jgi:hypothetical protein